jgi:hypothetical protein
MRSSRVFLRAMITPLRGPSAKAQTILIVEDEVLNRAYQPALSNKGWHDKSVGRADGCVRMRDNREH